MSIFTSRAASLVKNSIKGEIVVSHEEVASSDSSSVTSNEALTMVNSNELSSGFKLIRVLDTAKWIMKKFTRELEDVTVRRFETMDLNAYLAYIADERLVHMPARGSQWDRVLKKAEFFGLQLDDFANHIKVFVDGCGSIRDTALVGCHLLLELGHEQADALEPTFNALYELALLLGQTARLSNMFTVNDAIKHDITRIFDSLIRLIGNVAFFYRQRINTIYSGSVTIDFEAEFGSQITEIWKQREHLYDHIWAYKLRNNSYPVDISTLRQQLLPTKQSVKSTVYGRAADRKLRVEGTCDWIHHDLYDFLSSSDRIFTITGSDGCGKSMIASWVRERLERPVNRVHYETISYTFSNESSTEASPVSFLKSLLSQLLEINVGDVALFEKLAGIYEKLSSRETSPKLEEALWTALGSCLAIADKRPEVNHNHINLTLVIDGLDKVSGEGSKAKDVHNKLLQILCSLNLTRVKAVTISRPISHLGGGHCKHLVIGPEHIRYDIELFLTAKLKANCCFASQDEQSKRSLVLDVSEKAKGSFLYAYLAVELFAAVSNFAAFKEVINRCGSDIKAVFGELMKKVNLKEESGESNTYNLFTYMIAAKRPLTVGEMTELLGVHLSNRTISSGADVQAAVRNTRGLVVLQRGTLRFKHPIVKKLVTDLCGSTFMTLNNAHRHMTMALLLFAKKKFRYACEPSLDLIAEDILHDCFHAHHIVHYMMSHWMTHFRSSSLYAQNGTIPPNPELNLVFPDSTFFVMLEWYHWQDNHGIEETIQMHDLSLRIRHACLGDQNRAYLQNLIILGSLHRHHSETKYAAEFFYKASCLGQTVLYKFSPLVVSCTNLFLTCTETITITTRTTIVKYREEMIKFMIEICKGKNGGQSDAVIKWYEILAKLYIDIEEEETALEIYRELHTIVTIRFGRGSKMECRIAEAVSGMKIVLKADDGGRKHNHLRDLLFETTEELSFTDIRRITIMINLALDYEARGMFIQAERLYISLWRSFLEECRLKMTIELHIQKINIAIKYIRFLERRKRVDEACNILICLWAEYETHKFESELIIIHIKELAILAKSFGILTISMSMLKRVWGWFKERKTVETEEALSTTVIITEVVEEITETIVETKTTTSVVETVTREIWETTYNRCRGGKVDKSFFKSCLALVNLYVKLQKWSEAEVVIRKSLEITWKGVLNVDVKLTIEGEFVSERILVARRLALCYHRQRQFEKAEQIYLRLYHVCFSHLKVENVLFFEVAEALVQFYEDFHRHEKVIEIYVKLLQHYRKHLTAHHHLTINVLYKLADVYHKLGRKEAYECYHEIVTVLTKDGCVHASAVNAAITVLNYYYAEKRWEDLRKICVTIWTTFVHHHHEIKFTEEMVELIYERYRYVLEFHAKVEFSVRYKLTIEYRETVTKVFGALSAIVIKAMIALAELCEASEEHYHESITIYEEIIKKRTTTTTVTETTVRTIKKRLSTLYVTVITKGKVTTKVSVERAIAIGIEVYEHLRVELGWWHEKTLIQLKEVVLLYKKIGTKESSTCIIQMLQASVLEIIKTVKTSMTLHIAAKTLASIYVSSGMVHCGHDLLRQLRYLLLFPGFEGGEKDITIGVLGKASKVSLVFLITFEQALDVEAKVVYSFSEIMADVLLETVLYEQYISVMSTITESTTIEIVIEHAASLRFVWEARGRTSFVSVLDKKLFSMFTARYAKALGPYAADSKITFEFYVSLLREIGGGLAADRGRIDFGYLACKAAESVVRRLMVKEKNFGKAQGVAKCAFHFVNAQRFYHNRRCYALGFSLAKLLAGVNVDAWKSADASVKESLLSISRDVLQSVLNAVREDKVEFSSLQFRDISSLIHLLGEQKNYTELENILTSLWRSREVQRNCGMWSPDVVLNIGLLLVNAHELASHLDQATVLCETIYYNVRQSRGGLDPQALYFSKRLGYLYRRAHRLRDAARLHLEVVCDLDEHLTATRGADKEERLRAAADMHLDGMRRCGWASRGDVKMMRDTMERLRGYGKLSVASVESWGPVSAADEKKEASLVWPETITWDLKQSAPEEEVKKETKKRNLVAPAKERWQYRGFQQPGIGLVH
ncbi:hypothetical protein CCHL11_06795 [Colletotrichum chlorophyti]|uniref:Nephrocystin 3-like N-terminal domain-containing protein n=1 Tax=Colletotrichum chlorophyti TaxID=708187 RepID=A0A1Q8S975_9PEZI|nr:hypothetical protein CCHL11_06795 [Colletotrichum chlorophyti]